jgi:hypothetical protein
MNRYKVVSLLGDGTYGSVLKAVNKQTNEVVRHAPMIHFPRLILSMAQSIDRALARARTMCY